MSSFKRITLVVAVLLGTSLLLHAQVVKTDRLYLKTGETVFNVQVLEETWEKILVDNNKDGKADRTYNPNEVSHVQYGTEPMYMTKAALLKNRQTGMIRDPQQMLSDLQKIYTDAEVPVRIRQHAYHDIGLCYLQMANARDKHVEDAVKAYERLFRDIPDTVYAVTGRFEVAELLVEKKRADEAQQILKPVVDGKFGEVPAVRAKLILARLMLSGERYGEAQRLLEDLAAGKSLTDAVLKYEVRLMLCRAMIAQKKFDDAYKGVEAVLAEKPGKDVLGMTWNVLGHHFAERGRLKEALTAYLRVIMMYPEAGEPELARAYREAIRILEKMERREDADRLREEFEKKLPAAATGEA